MNQTTPLIPHADDVVFWKGVVWFTRLKAAQIASYTG